MVIISLLFAFYISQITFYVLFVSSALYFALGIFIGKKTSKVAVSTAISITVLLFLIFKYKVSLFEGLFVYGVPIGLSYYLIQNLSYTMDVYNGKVAAENKFSNFLLYNSYFPKLFSGPIERYSSFNLSIRHTTSVDNVLTGFTLIIWGLFKKLVIANRLAVISGIVFNANNNYRGIILFIALLLYSIQIYTDFSGYTDIARGISYLFGIKLTDNFNRPYFSTSVSEFWTRWHITLSNFLKDYVFIPLSNRISHLKILRKITGNNFDIAIYSVSSIITMGLIGVWHGLTLNFFLWGILHSLFMIFSIIKRRISKKNKKLKKLLINRNNFIKTGITYLLVSISWVFFVYESFSEVFKYFVYIFHETFSIKYFTQIIDTLRPIWEGNGFVIFNIVVLTISVLSLYLVELKLSKFKYKYNNLKVWQKILIISISPIVLLLLSKFDNSSFLYVQF